MDKYRKKPVVIQAMRHEGLTTDHSVYPSQLLGSDGLLDTSKAAFAEDGGLLISTLEGEMRADPGDYIIVGVQGEVYPIKESIFRETYEPVEES